MDTKKFQRKTENFVCENCGEENIGSGYTNHCRFCLYSKHVDINPGDRDCQCHGLMVPIALKVGEPGKLTHKCSKCGAEKQNKVADNDDFDALLAVARGDTKGDR